MRWAEGPYAHLEAGTCELRRQSYAILPKSGCRFRVLKLSYSQKRRRPRSKRKCKITEPTGINSHYLLVPTHDVVRLERINAPEKENVAVVPACFD